MRRFGLLRVEAGNIIVEKLVRPVTSNRFVPFEELLDVIHEAHIEKGLPDLVVTLCKKFYVIAIFKCNNGSYQYL